MYNEEQDIEKLFSRKLEHFEMKTSEDEWIGLNSKLSRFNFLKFSIVSFNVYYLTVMLAMAGGITFSSIRNSALKKDLKHLEQKVQHYEQTLKNDSALNILEMSDTIAFDSTKIEVQPEIKHQQSSLTQQAKGVPADEPKPAELSLKKTEIDSINKPIIPPTTDTVTQVKRIKKILVVKPQAVVVKDTVRITRPK